MAPLYTEDSSSSFTTSPWTITMDYNITTQPMANGNGQAVENSSIPKYLPIVILVTGVVGGLILVICVIVFCKYCIKKKKPLRRQQAFFKKFPADYQRPQYRPAPKEADDLQLGRQLLNDGLCGSEKAVRESLADNGVDRYARNLNGNSYSHLQEPVEEDIGLPTTHFGLTEQDIDIGVQDIDASPSTPRRVSFQVKLTAKDPHYSSSSRYIEGDFHHLKNARISKTPSNALITASMETDHGSLGNLEELAYVSVSELSESEQTDNLKPSEAEDVEIASTPSPTRQLPPHTTEVAVQVHHSADEDDIGNKLKSCALGLFPVKLSKHASFDVSSSKRNRKWDIPQQAVSLDEHDTNQTGKPSLSYKLKTLSNLASKKEHLPSEDKWATLEKTNDLTGIPNDANEYKKQIPGPPPEIAIEEGTSPEKVERKMISANDYRELWHLRTTLEQEDSNGSPVTSEPDTVVPASMSREDLKLSENNQSNHTGIESEFTYYESTEMGKAKKKMEKSQEPEDKNRLTVQRPRLSRTKDDSLDYAFSSISTEESDTSERSRGGDSSYEKDGGSKLKQMQADSGYTSIEQQQRPPTLSILQKRSIYASSDRDSTSIESTTCPSYTSTDISPVKETPPMTLKEKAACPKRRYFNKDGRSEVVFRARDDPRTASKKRREFTAEGKSGALYDSFSFPEDESEIDSQTSAYESPNDQRPKLKRSDSFGDRVAGRIGRFFKKEREDRYETQYNLSKRDYSIDEKTDALFKEFLRQDTMFDDPPQIRVHGRASISKGRLHLQRKQYSDPLIEKKMLNIPTTERSASFEHRRPSLDRDSSREDDYPPRPPRYSERPRKLVPQDSIEEEYLRQESSRIWEGKAHLRGQAELRDAKTYYSEKRKEIVVRPKRLLPQESTSDEDYSKGQPPPRPRYFKYSSKGMSLPEAARRSGVRSHPRKQLSVPEIREQRPYRQDSISEEETPPPSSRSRFDFERAWAKEYMKQESISEEDVPSAKSSLEFRRRPLRDQSRQESISEEDVPGSVKSRLDVPPMLERPHSASSLHRLQRQMTSPETFSVLDVPSLKSLPKSPRSAFRIPDRTRSEDHSRHVSPSRENIHHSGHHLNTEPSQSGLDEFAAKSPYKDTYHTTSPAPKRHARLERYGTRNTEDEEKV